MDIRLAFLIGLGLFGLAASRYADPGYSEAWLFLGSIALVWSAVVGFRNWRRPTGKHSPGRRH